jgi:hypothetical protein
MVMKAKITIAVCMFVAGMNHASAAIVDVDTELRAFATSATFWADESQVYTDTDERTATFSGYGSFSVGAQAEPEHTVGESALADVTASVQPHAIGIGTYLAMGGSSQQAGSWGTATATVNFNLSEAGVWSAKPLYGSLNSGGIQQAQVSLLRDGQEVYRQDCSGFDGLLYCVPYYGDEMANPDYVGRSLELQQGDYTLLLTASEGTSSNASAGGGLSLDLQVVPVPAALPLFLSALAAFGLLGWRRR